MCVQVGMFVVVNILISHCSDAEIDEDVSHHIKDRVLIIIAYAGFPVMLMTDEVAEVSFCSMPIVSQRQ